MGDGQRANRRHVRRQGRGQVGQQPRPILLVADAVDGGQRLPLQMAGQAGLQADQRLRLRVAAGHAHRQAQRPLQQRREALVAVVHLFQMRGKGGQRLGALVLVGDGSDGLQGFGPQAGLQAGGQAAGQGGQNSRARGGVLDMGGDGQGAVMHLARQVRCQGDQRPGLRVGVGQHGDGIQHGQQHGDAHRRRRILGQRRQAAQAGLRVGDAAGQVQRLGQDAAGQLAFGGAAQQRQQIGQQPAARGGACLAGRRVGVAQGLPPLLVRQGRRQAEQTTGAGGRIGQRLNIAKQSDTLVEGQLFAERGQGQSGRPVPTLRRDGPGGAGGRRPLRRRALPAEGQGAGDLAAHPARAGVDRLLPGAVRRLQVGQGPVRGMGAACRRAVGPRRPAGGRAFCPGIAAHRHRSPVGAIALRETPLIVPPFSVLRWRVAAAGCFCPPPIL